MRRHSLPRALLLSFYSAGVYRDAARHWRGAALLHLLVLAAIGTALVAIRVHTAVGRIATRDAPPLIAQLPRIVVDRGTVSVSAPTPYVIRDPRTGREAAILDTSGTVTSLEGREARLLLTRHQVMLRRDHGETRIYDLSGVNHFELHAERAARWAKAAAVWAAPLTAPFVLFGFYVVRLFQALVGAAFALLAGAAMRARLDFSAAMRIAALAITPPTLLLDLAGFLGAGVPWAGPAWAVMAAGWTLFAVRSCARPEPADADPHAVPAPH
jgi:hypothetical protein